MDFNSFDSRSVADEGRPLHLTNPGTGALLWDDEGPSDPDNPDKGRSNPCTVYVYGAEGRIAQEAFRETAKLPKLADVATQAEYHERLCETARKLIAGFENVERGDRPAGVADADWFLGLNISNPARGKGRSFAEQVLAFSGSRGEYLGKPAAASSEPRTRSAGKTRAAKVGNGHAAKK